MPNAREPEPTERNTGGQNFSEYENQHEIINTIMGSLKKRRKAKINKHKRSKRMRQNRHKKRLRYKS